jgi:hypothetical protein
MNTILPTQIVDLPLVYQTNKIEFYYDENKDLLVSLAKNFSPNTEYRQNMEVCLKIAQEKNLKRILFESSKFKGTSPENQKWIMDYMVPAWAAAGVKKIGSVLPIEIFGKFAINNMIQGSLSLGVIEIKAFNNFNECYEWVCS